MNKADYVRQASPDPEEGAAHTCHWPGCTAVVDPKMWGCKPHWFALPPLIRARIWAAFRPGQEVSKNPSMEYKIAAHQAQTWIAQREAERADTSRSHDTRTPDLFDGR